MSQPSPGTSTELPASGDGLSKLLRRAPMPQLSALAAAHEGAVYLVGGALRDAMLGLEVADLDIAVETGLEDFLRSVATATGRKPAPIGDRWRQTHRMRWHGRQLDLALLLSPLEEDLAQRDFTVNAMALPLPAPEDALRGLVDPCQGQRDLKKRKIRCVSESVLDADPLRLLRAVRYVAVLPEFDLDSATATAVAERAASIDRSAAERVQSEWKFLLEGEGWLAGIEMARSLDLASRSFISLDDLSVAYAWSEQGDESALTRVEGPGLLAARLAAVVAGKVRARGLDQVSESLLARRWPLRLIRQATQAADWSQRAHDAGDNNLADWVLSDRVAAALAALLAAACARSRNEPVSSGVVSLQALARRAGENRWVRGRDLRAWGMDEGPELGAVLAEAARGQVLRRWDGSEEASDWARSRVVSSRQRTTAFAGGKKSEAGQ
jgi:tRNA nucleotidyltransferase/poly(A) polymerase